MAGTLNELKNEPKESAETTTTCSVSSKTGIPLCPAAKPFPFTVTRVPRGPRWGEMEIVDSTVKVALAVPAPIL